MASMGASSVSKLRTVCDMLGEFWAHIAFFWLAYVGRNQFVSKNSRDLSQRFRTLTIRERGREGELHELRMLVFVRIRITAAFALLQNHHGETSARHNVTLPFPQ